MRSPHNEGMNQKHQRCFGTGDPLYEAYHDDEWGQPLADSPDERDLFERLSLEGFMVGLSWLTVLRKREAFRRAFHSFHPEKVAAMGQDEVQQLLEDASIIRNRRKIEAVITNAQALLALHAQGDRLAGLFAEFTPEPRQHRAQDMAELPPFTSEAVALTKELKRRGFTFVGPTTLYSTMQAIGLVDDHVAHCWKAGATPS